MLLLEDLFEGMQLQAKFTKVPDPCWTNTYIPIRIEKEYPRFFVCTVLPHRNPRGMDDSLPYTVTIDKFNMKRGEVLCKMM